MLYTRKGDGGSSQIFGAKKGERISKADPRFALLGTLDELNTFIGVCRAQARDNSASIDGDTLSDILVSVQHQLFTLQAECAGADKALNEAHVATLERYVDWIEKVVPPISSFLLPGATEQSAWLDVARAVTRRAERQAVQVQADTPVLSAASLQYLNRLSSLFYALVRYVNHQHGVEESAPQYQ